MLSLDFFFLMIFSQPGGSLVSVTESWRLPSEEEQNPWGSGASTAHSTRAAPVCPGERLSSMSIYSGRGSFTPCHFYCMCPSPIKHSVHCLLPIPGTG